ncbi:kinase-like protein [Lophium mytilinum]|uniref:Kinase-like protein n=1 Tax=Lophium mytilinum TaxID=390894 RepID=A0A6A6QSV1_9PEZI|nr:kinase-like protein [Lophium mytilinum]
MAASSGVHILDHAQEDLVLDSYLQTTVHEDRTIHSYVESSASRGRTTFQEHWKQASCLGLGGYGEVCLEECIEGRNSGAFRAVKKIRKVPQARIADFLGELKAVAKFSAPKYETYFVKSFGWYENANTVYIAMEYYPLGDLRCYLSRVRQIPLVEAQFLTRQILEGLQKMHENDFAHRDLKPANILIESQPPGVWLVKLADFGVSKRASNGNEPSTIKGTRSYLAPELFFARRYTDSYDHKAADLWALGEIAFQMLTGDYTFQDEDALRNYVQGVQEYPKEHLKVVTGGSGTALISSLMAVNPHLRTSAAVALRHPWMQLHSSNPFRGITQSTTPNVDVSLSARTRPLRGSDEATVREAFASWSGTSGARIIDPQTYSRITASPSTTFMPQPDRAVWTSKRPREGENNSPRNRSRPEAQGYSSPGNIGSQSTSSSSVSSAQTLHPPFPSEGIAATVYPSFGSGGRDTNQTQQPTTTVGFRPSDSSVFEEPWKLLRTLEVSTDSVGCVAFSADSKLLAIGCRDGWVRIVDPYSGASLRTLKSKRYNYPLIAVGWCSDDSKTVASASGYELTLWDVDAQKGKNILRPEYKKVLWPVRGTLPSPLNSPLIVLQYDGIMRHDGRATLIVVSYLGSKAAEWKVKHRRSVRYYVVSPDDKMIATVTRDSYIRVWDIPSKQRVYKWNIGANHKGPLALSPHGGGKLASAAEGSNVLKVWNSGDGKVIWTSSQNTTALAYSPDGTMLVSTAIDVAYSYAIRLWNAGSGVILHAFHGFTLYVPLFSPNSKFLVIYDRSKAELELWDTRTGGVLQKFKHTSMYASPVLAFSPDNKLLATVDRNLVNLWTVR